LFVVVSLAHRERAVRAREGDNTTCSVYKCSLGETNLLAARFFQLPEFCEKHAIPRRCAILALETAILEHFYAETRKTSVTRRIGKFLAMGTFLETDKKCRDVLI